MNCIVFSPMPSRTYFRPGSRHTYQLKWIIRLASPDFLYFLLCIYCGIYWLLHKEKRFYCQINLFQIKNIIKSCRDIRHRKRRRHGYIFQSLCGLCIWFWLFYFCNCFSMTGSHAYFDVFMLYKISFLKIYQSIDCSPNKIFVFQYNFILKFLFNCINHSLDVSLHSICC